MNLTRHNALEYYIESIFGLFTLGRISISDVYICIHECLLSYI
jgi:hypothetical protein